ncbi:MAG: hypothetical protein LBP53_00965 [Candidatus Peribacteria bacterium]|nr:hypothetical protein [Candidatus Peribacteria bacterium]
MKQIRSIVLFCVLIVLLLFFGRTSLETYLATHTYYTAMLTSGTNR